MNLYRKFLLTLISVLVLSVHADRRTGIERMERFDMLPVLMKGSMARQYSSRDRNGGNSDGFRSEYSWLYQDENGEYVLFEERVPGCLYRIWMTMAEDNMDRLKLRFYFDGETTHRFELLIRDMCNGDVYPFLNPIVGDRVYSSGGIYCYVPFPYEKGLKVTLTENTDRACYYNFSFMRYDSSDGITTWTGTENVDAVVAAQVASGSDPKPTNGNSVVTGSFSVPGNSDAVFYADSGTGVVQSIRFDTSSLSAAEMENLELVFNWDGGVPEVEVPFYDFFSYRPGGIDSTSLPYGMNAAGESYCFFPMPYWEEAELSIRNKSSSGVSNISFEVQQAGHSFDRAETGYFCTQFLQETFGSNGRDYIFANLQGRGHLVGTSIYMDPDGSGLSYLEGDERIYIDGSQTPAIYGTGAEDYFNCGWYYKYEEVSRPYHGCTYKSGGSTMQYRLHITDAIPFNSSIKAGIEHGVENRSSGTFKSVVYYYLAGDQPDGLTLVANLDHGDAWSETLYTYERDEGNDVSGTWRYEGDSDNVSISDVGYAYNGGLSSFSVALPENEGLLLRRRSDQGVGGQLAHVFVDDIYAGTWYEPDHRMAGVNKRWIDSEFLIPAEWVAEKSTVEISILPLGSSPLWNEYRCQVYSVNPYVEIFDSDADGLPDDWEFTYAASLTNLSGDADSDLDGLTDLEEYIADTHPGNQKSRFSLNRDYSFDSVFGRVYALEECTNLVEGIWYPVLVDIPGNGTEIRLPEDTGINADAVYRRLRVEKP